MFFVQLQHINFLPPGEKGAQHRWAERWEQLVLPQGHSGESIIPLIIICSACENSLFWALQPPWPSNSLWFALFQQPLEQAPAPGAQGWSWALPEPFLLLGGGEGGNHFAYKCKTESTFVHFACVAFFTNSFTHKTDVESFPLKKVNNRIDFSLHAYLSSENHFYIL